MRVRPALLPRRRAASAALVALLASIAVGLGPVAPAVGASGPLELHCTSNGSPSSVTLTVDADTEAPLGTGPMRIGQSVPATLSSALPGPVAADAVARGADRFSGVVHLGISEGGTVRTLDLAVPVTDLGDQGTPADVPFLATGSYTALHAGDWWVAIRDATIDLDLLHPDGSATHLSLTCPSDGSGYLDYIQVLSTSTTTLTLSASPVASYGQPIVATARVDVDDLTTFGRVSFRVDQVEHLIDIHDSPLASMTLPPLAIGVHQVAATYQTFLYRNQTGSESAPQTLTVVGALTRTIVNVTGRAPQRRTRAVVRVRAAYDTIPTGRVRLTLRELGTTHHSVVRARLDAGSAVVRLGRLGPGRYRLVTTYRGDGNHARSRATRVFEVRATR
ncbi:hypothetical protein J2X46_000104 [Nocardioides sp. BE266]|uniref:hypothetical protein n=1 Tax=Nocardioides sp. BE266 TaxID=2817725 RepID=UPI002864040F|nr:hypothetical protein [Nocardioides sp. BE266]MDR7251132.1 hypothetical protein [Nocardioides sp. BE266]